MPSDGDRSNNRDFGQQWAVAFLIDFRA